MYKKLILAVVLLFLVGTAFAQNHEDQWIWPDDITTDVPSLCLYLGPKLGGGIALATASTQLNTSFHNGFCYQLGISANGRFDCRLSKNIHGINRIGFAIEALLNGRNIRTEGDVMTLVSIEIPILFKFYLRPNISLEAGTTLVAPLKVKPETLQIQNIVLHIGEMKAADVMLTIGANYQVISNLTIGVRSNIGTSPMAENIDSRVNTLMFSASYWFPILK